MKKIFIALLLLPVFIKAQTPNPSLDTTHAAKAVRATKLLLVDGDSYFPKLAESDSTVFAAFDLYGKLIKRNRISDWPLKNSKRLVNNGLNLTFDSASSVVFTDSTSFPNSKRSGYTFRIQNGGISIDVDDSLGNVHIIADPLFGIDLGYNNSIGTIKNRIKTDKSGTKIYGNFQIVDGINLADSILRLTKFQADSLINLKKLRVGNNYRIKNTHPSLYGGTDIILRAVAPDAFAKKGTGIFYNPRYNQALPGMGIADTSNHAINNDPTRRVIWGGYVWAPNDENAPIATDILTILDWYKAPYDSIIYKIAYDEIEYDYNNNLIIMRYDPISNIRVYCSNNNLLRIVDLLGYPYNPIAVTQWGNPFNYDTNKGVGEIDSEESYCESINMRWNFYKIFQRGGSVISNIFQKNVGEFFNIRQSNESYLSNLNINGSSSLYNINQSESSMTNMNVTGSLNIISINQYQGYIQNIFGTQGTITSINQQTSSIYSIKLDTSELSNIIQTLSSISGLHLGKNSFFRNSRQINSNIDFNLINYVGKVFQKINFVDTEGIVFTNVNSATYLFGNYTKEVYKRLDGTIKLAFYNNSDIREVHLVTD